VTEDEIASLNPDDNLLVDLDSDIWLMDDHRWAFYVWQRFGIERQIPRFSLVHVDYHWDSVNDFHDDEQMQRELRAANLAKLYGMVREADLIRYDSFIAPAVIRGLVGEVHFLCRQTDVDEHGLDEDLLLTAGAQQYFYDDANSIANVEFGEPVIFDLCLDIFNRSEQWAEGDLWPEDEIEAFLHQLRPVIESATVVTVSLSFNYSGTASDTRRLAALCLPLLKRWRTVA